MKTIYFDNSVKSRENIEMCFDQWKNEILEQFDKGQMITFHSHTETRDYGEYVEVLGSTNVVSVGHFPDELKLR